MAWVGAIGAPQRLHRERPSMGLGARGQAAASVAT
jgi:hypothetical protein